MANLEEELVVGPSGPSQDPWSGSWYATHEAYLRASLEKSRVRYLESLRALKAAFPRVASCCADFEAGKCAQTASPASVDGSRPRGHGWCTCRVADFVIVTWKPAVYGSPAIASMGWCAGLIYGGSRRFLDRSEGVVPPDG